MTKEGRKASGGHVFRVGGSRHLALLGVAISIIMLMARWGSDLVMHYLRDSRIANITSQYLRVASGSQDAAPAGRGKPRRKFALAGNDRKQVDDLAAQCEEQ